MRRYTMKVNDVEKVVDVEAVGANLFRVQIDGRLVDVELDDHRDLAHGAITPQVQPLRVDAAVAPAASGAAASGAATGGVRGERPQVGTPTGPSAGAARASGETRDKLTAPMPGVILAIGTAVGASVLRGDPLLVLEAMKMKNELRAPRDGVVAEIYVVEGQQVKYGEFLVRFDD